MLKLNASFSKKVPAEQEYSSKGFSASIEVEIPDGLNQEQLQERIHNTFALVESSVEAELQNKGVTVVSAEKVQQQSPQTTPVQKALPISPKQLKYLSDLIRDTRFEPSQYLKSIGLNSVYELSKTQSSKLIDLIKNSQQKAA